MAYFLRVEELGETQAGTIEHLFADLWINLLESRAPMALGPPPFSVVSLLESIRRAIRAAELRSSTLSKQITTAIDSLERRLWLRLSYPDQCDRTVQALAAVVRTPKPKPQNFASAVDAIDVLLTAFESKRVSLHLDFILGLSDPGQPEVGEEIKDFVADLIALGHSESFLYGWGRAVLLAQEPLRQDLPLRERLAQLGELGRPRKFLVAFKARAGGTLPKSEVFSFGKRVLDDFRHLEPWAYEPDEVGVLVKLAAPDYKAAIEDALDRFSTYVLSLAFTRRFERVRPIGTEFRVRCENDDTELAVGGDSVRPYEPPPLIHGNAISLCNQRSPDVAGTLTQVLYWLSSSRRVRKEAEFLNLWLALVSLFKSDEVEIIIPALARYRLALLVQLLANWIGDYLGNARQLRWDGLTSTQIQVLNLARPRESRLLPIVRAATESDLLVRAATSRPLLMHRVSQLRSLCRVAERDAQLKRLEAGLHVVLPWVQSLRHGVAHFGSVPITSLDLTNQHLREDVTLTFDQVAASALGQPGSTLLAIHQDTVRNFDALMARVLREPCLSVLHVRQGLEHSQPLKAKYWAV